MTSSRSSPEWQPTEYHEPAISTREMVELSALKGVLHSHYLATINCDHKRKMDQPICNCSLVDLGWHPSVGAAVIAWVEHVVEECRR